MGNYNRSRYYTQSTSSRLMDSQDAHGKTLEELRVSKEQATHWKSVAKWFATQYATANNMTVDDALEVYYDEMEKTV